MYCGYCIINKCLVHEITEDLLDVFFSTSCGSIIRRLTRLLVAYIVLSLRIFSHDLSDRVIGLHNSNFTSLFKFLNYLN